MPMLYGEGEKTLLRLQEKIIKEIDDHTIFAWSICHESPGGLLADSPARFADCQYIKYIKRLPRIPIFRSGNTISFAMKNRGFSIKMSVTQHILDTCVVYLDNRDETPTANGFDHGSVGIYVRRLDEDDQYARLNLKRENFRDFPDMESSEHHELGRSGFIGMYVCQHRVQPSSDFQSDRVTGFRFTQSTIPVIENSHSVIDVGKWDLEILLPVAPITVSIKPKEIV